MLQAVKGHLRYWGFLLLKLVGAAAKLLRGEIPVTDELPDLKNK